MNGSSLFSHLEPWVGELLLDLRQRRVGDEARVSLREHTGGGHAGTADVEPVEADVHSAVAMNPRHCAPVPSAAALVVPGDAIADCDSCDTRSGCRGRRARHHSDLSSMVSLPSVKAITSVTAF